MWFSRFGFQFMFLGLIVLVAACGGTPTPELTVSSGATQGAQTSYPGPILSTLTYPGPTLVNPFRTPEPPTNLPTPGPGKATVAGVLYSFTIHALVPGTLLYLTPGVGPDKRGIPPVITGPSDAAGSVRGQSNDDAQFVLTNVPPGNYYLVVSASLTWSLGVAAIGETKPVLIEVKENQTLNLGVVYLSWS